MAERMSDKHPYDWIELECVLQRYCKKFKFKPRAPLHDIASMVMDNLKKEKKGAYQRIPPRGGDGMGGTSKQKGRLNHGKNTLPIGAGQDRRTQKI